MLDLSRVAKIRSVLHWYTEADQLYHPTGVFGEEKQDVVYSCDMLCEKRFIPILLKEWFFLIQKGGYIVADYRPTKFCTWQQLEEKMWWLWKGKYEIIFHGPVSDSDFGITTTEVQLKNFIKEREHYYVEGLQSETFLPEPLITRTRPLIPHGHLRFICKKITSTRLTGDEMGKWTFGIITNGKRLEWLQEAIASIRKQNISQSEIIICGAYPSPREANVIYIPFNQRDDLGWTTKKKNLIVQRASYENLCIIHDRFRLVDDWFEKIKKWGNSFEFLWMPSSPVGEDIDGRMVSFFQVGSLAIPYTLRNNDWSYNIFSGSIIVTKKTIYQKVLQNESAYWGCNNNSVAEDLFFSYEIIRRGYIFRNPNVKFFESFAERRSALGYGILQKSIYAVCSFLGRHSFDSQSKFSFPFRLINRPFIRKSLASRGVKN